MLNVILYHSLIEVFQVENGLFHDVAELIIETIEFEVVLHLGNKSINIVAKFHKMLGLVFISVWKLIIVIDDENFEDLVWVINRNFERLFIH